MSDISEEIYEEFDRHLQKVLAPHFYWLVKEGDATISALVASLEEILPMAGHAQMDEAQLLREHGLGNEAAEPILRARAALALARIP